MVNADFFISYLENFSYFGIFLALVISGYLIPFPEEILVLIVGYAAAAGFVNLYIAALVSIAALIAGDNILFWLSKTGHATKFAVKVKKSKLAKFRKYMEGHIGKTIFLFRFIIGLRILSPYLAASMKVKWKKFQFYDLLAILIYVPVLIFIGYHFHNNLAVLLTKFAAIRHFIFLVISITIGIIVTLYINNKFFKKSYLRF